MPSQNGFDAFRWIAALIIVVSHFCGLTQTELPVMLPTQKAVQFFFILSGALTYRSFLSKPGTLGFYRRRARRILPAYWGTLVFCLLVGLLFTEMPLRDFVVHPQTWSYVGWNTVMLNRLQPALPGVFADHVLPAMDGALWTMKYEVAFYLLLPALVFLMRRTNKLWSLVTIYVLLTVLQVGLSFTAWMEGGETMRLLAARGVSQAACFVAGMLVSETYDTLARHRRWVLPLAVVVCVVSCLWWPVRIVWPIAYAIAIILLGTASPRLGICRRLPPLTYELFLIHFPIVQAAVEAGLPQHLDLPTAFAAILALSLFYAYLLHHSVKPITDKK